MKTKEIRQTNISELQKLLKDKKSKLGSLNFDLVGGKVKNIKEMREARKDIAKILTVLKENETSSSKAKQK
ncbi:MAG TPA: 50S ribosomal protein L29 [Candidatus Paceibacterota bacterium]|nr:50S ribosomal protein L29 [Candidatus Pacearchaeota archaeon]HRZ50955.1 50S ribosomal protein L29 [Candidatus Paceibacterota bacterium]HSA36676.1 50S ribosomal protein L29 [Candidatus Paceibacterota bacterium]